MKQKANPKIIAAIIGILVLALGLAAGIILVKQQQDIREKADDTAPKCSVKWYFSIKESVGDQNSGKCVQTNNTYDASFKECTNGSLCSDNLKLFLDPKYAGSARCFSTFEECSKPDGKSVNFLYFFNSELNACSVTNHRYDSNQMDVDGTNQTCSANVTQFTEGKSKGVCYTSLDACKSDNIAKVITPTVSTSCSSGKSIATVNWKEDGMGSAGYYIDVNDSNKTTWNKGSFWNKLVSSGSTVSTQVPDGFKLSDVGSAMPDLVKGKVYNVRVFYNATSIYSEVVSFVAESCNVASATATATSTPTTVPNTNATPTATSTTKATATATSTTVASTSTSAPIAVATATAFPVPETGSEWPTILGASFGVLIVVASFLLAL